MKILIAPDKFKDCLPADKVAAALARGLRRSLPTATLDTCPLSDGGEGFVQTLVHATGGSLHSATVTGPLPEQHVAAQFGLLGPTHAGAERRADRRSAAPGPPNPQSKIQNPKSPPPLTAVIEMSSASGLALVPPSDRNPFTTTTFGTGQLLLAATKLGATHILLGIGGSATCDAGIGCCQGAGLTVLTVDGSPVSPTEPLTPRDLENILAVKHARGSPIDRVHITVACDVTNPLFGPTGAARVYGPQKGASPDDVEQLDRLLRDFATRTGKLAEAQTPGAGAAGGLGFGLLAFFNATLRPGFDLVADALRLHDRLADADLCITAEGRLDASTLHGKAPVGLARLCRPLHVPCIAVGGSVDPTALPQLQAEFSHVLPLADPPLPVDESLRRAEQLLESAGERIGTLVHRGQLPPND